MTDYTIKLIRLLDKYIIPDLSNIIVKYVYNPTYYRLEVSDNNRLKTFTFKGCFENLETCLMKTLELYLTKGIKNPILNVYNNEFWTLSQEISLINDISSIGYIRDSSYNSIFKIYKCILNQIDNDDWIYNFCYGELCDVDYELVNINFKPLKQFEKQIYELIKITAKCI